MLPLFAQSLMHWIEIKFRKVAELNPIYHLLALLRAHHILHVSRVRVNLDQSLMYWRHSSMHS